MCQIMNLTRLRMKGHGTIEFSIRHSSDSIIKIHFNIILRKHQEFMQYTCVLRVKKKIFLLESRVIRKRLSYNLISIPFRPFF